MAKMAVLAALAFCTIVLTGCNQEDAYGYVQIRRLAAMTGNEAYRLNGQTLDELSSNSSLVMKQKTGAAKIDLIRNGASRTLCVFDVGKNRIVTATIALERGVLKCTVQT